MHEPVRGMSFFFRGSFNDQGMSYKHNWPPHHSCLRVACSQLPGLRLRSGCMDMSFETRRTEKPSKSSFNKEPRPDNLQHTTSSWNAKFIAAKPHTWTRRRPQQPQSESLRVLVFQVYPARQGTTPNWKQGITDLLHAHWCILLFFLP